MLVSERPAHSNYVLGCPIYSQISMHAFKQVEKARQALRMGRARVNKPAPLECADTFWRQPTAAHF